MQQETQTLGLNLNQPIFVVVDNKHGEVALGSEFNSPLMNIVGYPSIGRNKKNKYFSKPLDLIAYFKQFKKAKRQKNKDIPACQDNRTDQSKVNKKNSKIEVKSICKYKLEESK